MVDEIRDQRLYSQILEFKPRKSDLRKVAILDAVIDCIATEGIDETNSQIVGKRSKMRRSHVAYYFPNRDSMVEAALKFVVTTGQEITIAHVIAAPTPAEKLEAFVTATFTWFERYPKHAAVMILLQYYGTVRPVYKKLHAQIRQAGEERLEAILSGQPLRKGVGKVQVRKLAQLIRALLVGKLTTYFSAESTTDEESYEELRKESLLLVQKLAGEIWLKK